MGKNTVDKDRKARVEEMRKQQQSVERRRTYLVIGAVVVVLALLIGLVTKVILDYQGENDLSAIGVPAAEAGCEPVSDEVAEGVGEHVEDRVDYDTVPPSSGPHRPSPDFPTQGFYGADDRPEVEALVHNLEHAYSILWYAEGLPDEQVDQLRTIRRLAAEDPDTGGKFIVSAWDASYGELPEETPVVLSHWGAEQGHRQYCAAVSGAVVEQFIADYPASDAPEPGAP